MLLVISFALMQLPLFVNVLFQHVIFLSTIVDASVTSPRGHVHSHPLPLALPDVEHAIVRRHWRRAAMAPAISPTTGSSETVLSLFVSEELHPGFTVGNVVRDYGLDRRYSPEVIASLRFQLLSHQATTAELPDVASLSSFDDDSVKVVESDRNDKTNRNKHWFAVDETTGVIQTERRIDREQLCPRSIDCFVKFDIVVQPITYFQIIKVSIDIDIELSTRLFRGNVRSYVSNW